MGALKMVDIQKIFTKIRRDIEDNPAKEIRLRFDTLCNKLKYEKLTEQRIQKITQSLDEQNIQTFIKDELKIFSPENCREFRKNNTTITFKIVPRTEHPEEIKIHNSINTTPLKNQIIKHFVPYKPYDHQKLAWKEMKSHYLNDDKNEGMVIVPTGGGKTFLAVHWLLENIINHGYRILWLTHNVTLLKQAKDTFEKFFYITNNSINERNIIIISGEDKNWANVDKSHSIVLSTIQTANIKHTMPKIELFVNQSKKGVFIVVDEAHHSVAPYYTKNVFPKLFDFRNKSKDIKLLGLTATPVRMNESETNKLAKIYKETIIQVKKSILIEKKILALPCPETVKTDTSFEQDFTDEDYKRLEQYGELSPHIYNKIGQSAKRNKAIVEHYKKNKEKYGKTIVFAVDKAHCKTLTQEFNNSGLDNISDYVAYDRNSNENNSIIEKYQDDTSGLDVIINVQKLTEGFDSPRTQTIFLARPTQSEALLQQMIGRGLRGPEAGGTEKAYLVSFVDTWKLFKPLESDYILDSVVNVEAEIEVQNGIDKNENINLIQIPDKLIYEVYKLINQGKIESVFNSLPYSWFKWTEQSEEDIHDELILVFDNQKDGFEKFYEKFTENINFIPEILNEDYINEITEKYFSDCKDPLPSSQDIFNLLNAIKNSRDISYITFEQKEEFSPYKYAILLKDKNASEIMNDVKNVLNDNLICQKFYKNNWQLFLNDVNKEIQKIVLSEGIKDDVSQGTVYKIEQQFEKPNLQQWDAGKEYELDEILRTVLENEGKIRCIHFPDGNKPKINRISFSEGKMKNTFGFFRWSDKSIKINRFLNSPDIPLFVLEYLVFHEALHADLGEDICHQSPFREREMNFQPTEKAIEEAKGIGHEDNGTVQYFWYALGDQFLNTISDKHEISKDI